VNCEAAVRVVPRMSLNAHAPATCLFRDHDNQIRNAAPKAPADFKILNVAVGIETP